MNVQRLVMLPSMQRWVRMGFVWGLVLGLVTGVGLMVLAGLAALLPPRADKGAASLCHFGGQGYSPGSVIATDNGMAKQCQVVDGVPVWG